MNTRAAAATTAANLSAGIVRAMAATITDRLSRSILRRAEGRGTVIAITRGAGRPPSGRGTPRRRRTAPVPHPGHRPRPHRHQQRLHHLGPTRLVVLVAAMAVVGAVVVALTGGSGNDVGEDGVGDERHWAQVIRFVGPANLTEEVRPRLPHARVAHPRTAAGPPYRLGTPVADGAVRAWLRRPAVPV